MRSRVLIVDDNFLDIELASAVVESSNLDYSVASNAYEALDKLSEEVFHLIILDLQMPMMSGLQLMRRLKGNENFGQIPIIVMSGRNKPNDVKVAMSLGAIDYVVKPVDVDIFEAKLKSHVLRQTSEWAEYSFPENRSPEVDIVLNSKIISISEIGLKLKTSCNLNFGQVLKLDSSFFDDIGFGAIKVKVDDVKEISGARFVSCSFLAISEEQRKQIRLFCRKSWAQEKEVS